MTKNKNNSPSDGTLKRVHTEVSDCSSSDEESMAATLKKSRVISVTSWPRFLVISSNDDGALLKLSPFTIQQGLEGLAGEPKSVKKMRNGSLLVECFTEKHSRCLLKSKIFCNISITVTAHSSLNSSKGVIRSRDLEGVSEDEICKNLSSQGVKTVKRINVRRNNELIPTNTLILTFDKPTLPLSVKAGYLNIPVVPFIPNPLRCFNCQKFGHGQNTCRNKLTCARCGQVDHDSKTCQNDMACSNCKGKHFAYSRECPKWKSEKQVQQVKVEKRLSYQEARKFVETFTPAVAVMSYAAAVKVSTNSISTQTDLTWPIDVDKYKKVSDITKAQKQATKAVQKQSSKMTQASSGSQNPPRSSTEEPGPSKTKTGKDATKTKSSSRDRSSGRLKKIEQKTIPLSNQYEPLDLDVDAMDVTSIDRPQQQRPKPKVPIIPVLPPDGK